MTTHACRWSATLSLAVTLSGTAGSALAALCVWINPDRDIKDFFPGASSYVTEVKKHTREQRNVIEERIATQLDPDENEFRFYRVSKAKKTVGTVLTHQARGRYGAVQVVVAIGNDDKVIGVRVQRHREPTNLNAPAFLKQFAGKTAADPITLGKDLVPIKGHEVSSHAVAFSVKKILIVHDVLGR